MADNIYYDQIETLVLNPRYSCSIVFDILSITYLHQGTNSLLPPVPF